MNGAQQLRTRKKAAQAVAHALPREDRLSQLRVDGSLIHLTSRLSTFQILIDDQIAALTREASRQNALALVLIADFCWQALRSIADRQGQDRWLEAVLPNDNEASDQDIGDQYFSMQKRLLQDTKWIFDLHSGLRHPSIPDADLLTLLRDPVAAAMTSRLLSAAKGIQQILLCTQARLSG